MEKEVVAILPQDLNTSLLPQPLRSRKFPIQESPEETAEGLKSALRNFTFREEEEGS